VAEVKELVQRLEEFEVLHFLTTADERQVGIYQALIETEELVSNLSDNRLKDLYQRVVEGQRSTTVRPRAVL